MQIKQENVDDVSILMPIRSSNPSATSGDIMGVRSLVNNLLEAGARKIIIDLEDIEMISSLEIGVLVGSVRSAQMKQALLVIAGLRLTLAETFDIVKINTILPIRITRQSALKDLRRLDPAKKNSLVDLLGKNPTVDEFRQHWRRQV